MLALRVFHGFLFPSQHIMKVFRCENDFLLSRESRATKCNGKSFQDEKIVSSTQEKCPAVNSKFKLENTAPTIKFRFVALSLL